MSQAQLLTVGNREATTNERKVCVQSIIQNLERQQKTGNKIDIMSSFKDRRNLENLFNY